MKSTSDDPFFTQMKTIYIYHHVYGQPSIEHQVEEYNHVCYLEPVPVISRFQATIVILEVM